jgi:cytochrome P450
MIPIPDLTSPAFKANPYPFYARLRAEHPVAKVRMPDGKPAWLLTRYADVQAALKDERLSKNPYITLSKEEQAAKLPWLPKFLQPLTQNMLDKDPPDHTRLRGLVSQVFTPRFIEQLRQRIESLCEELITPVRARGGGELIEDLALPLPLTVIADMLAVPKADRLRFRRWSQHAVNLSTPSQMLFAIPALWRFMRYVRSLVRDRRSALGDDLVSGLLRAKEAEDHLNEDELLSMIVLLLIAGHETTVNLIASGTLALLDFPEELERLRADRSLVKPAIEELLRYTSPVEIGTERYTREPVTFSGTEIPRGERVLPVIAAANYDAEQFPEPARLDISRNPNRHVAFGLGAHYCLGAALARLEGEAALNALLDRSSRLRLGTSRDKLTWRRSLFLRGLERLPFAVA